MTKDSTFTDTILRVERRDNSQLGNPAWLVYFENHGPLPTLADSSWSFEAGSPEWKNARVVVTVTPQGSRIRYCTHAEKKNEK